MGKRKSLTMAENVESLKTFLDQSKTFNSITFNGLYGMSTEHFIEIFNHFINTEVNLLDDYSCLIYLTWESPHNNMNEIEYDEFENNLIKISNIKKLKILNDETITTARINNHQLYSNHKKRLDKKSNLPRQKASRYTSRDDIKNEIFKIYGKKCLCCGSVQHITLDHVIPVSLGGKNKIENLQPLCRSCNSKKGVKKTDYRGGYNG